MIRRAVRDGLRRRAARVSPELVVGRITPEDHDDARAVVLAGLAEHWGRLDPALNRDLDDIATVYAGGTFLVAHASGALVGTGALLPRSARDAEIVRMSVRADHRRVGIATVLLDALVEDARARGHSRVVLETTSAWTASVAFYRTHGFAVTHTAPGAFGEDTYFERDL